MELAKELQDNEIGGTPLAIAWTEMEGFSCELPGLRGIPDSTGIIYCCSGIIHYFPMHIGWFLYSFQIVP
ncbi:MAG TPA: hypothetical protein VMC42_09530 [Methanoregulaceae archaeon]|nr:hypothetical protein [Methanoregulaceae archaeon]